MQKYRFALLGSLHEEVGEGGVKILKGERKVFLTAALRDSERCGGLHNIVSRRLTDSY